MEEKISHRGHVITRSQSFLYSFSVFSVFSVAKKEKGR